MWRKVPTSISSVRQVRAARGTDTVTETVNGDVGGKNHVFSASSPTAVDDKPQSFLYMSSQDPNCIWSVLVAILKNVLRGQTFLIPHLQESVSEFLENLFLENLFSQLNSMLKPLQTHPS